MADQHKHLHPVVASPLPEMLCTETSRLTVRWPIISMPLPEGPGMAVSGDMYVVTTAEFTAGARLTFSPTGVFPSVDARSAYSQTTASSFAQSFRMPSTSFLGFEKLPPAPTTQIAMVGWST